MSFNTRWFAGAMTMALSMNTGCDELATRTTHAPTLTRIQGTLSLDPNAQPPSGTLKVAVVWEVNKATATAAYNPCHLDGGAVPAGYTSNTVYEQHLIFETSVQQSVDVSPEFPASFHIDLTSVPPPEALWDARARGTIVVYIDGNGNGRLDPRPGSGDAPDEVLNTGLVNIPAAGLTPDDVTSMPHYSIVYYANEPDYFAGHFQPGYHVMKTGPDGLDVPVDTLDLSLAPSAAMQRVLCDDQCVFAEARSCPEGTTGFPTRPADAIEVIPKTLYTWQEGDRTIQDWIQCNTDALTTHYGVGWQRYEQTGCGQRILTTCFIGADLVPHDEWPCQQYWDSITKKWITKEEGQRLYDPARGHLVCDAGANVCIPDPLYGADGGV